MDTLPESWLRGPLPGVHPLLAPVLYSFRQAREDLERHTADLTPDQLWARPHGLTPAGFHLRHIGGGVERLMAYVQGRQLSEQQLAATRTESEPDAGAQQLLAAIDASFSTAEAVVRSLDPAVLTDPREVGRKRLPSTVGGLLVHIAEHTQRHVGQAIAAAKLARAVMPRD